MDPEKRPVKTADLEVSPVEDGYVVYQPARDRIHYLNKTAALVFDLCNGEVKASELPALVGAAFGLSDPPGKAVHDCLANMLSEGLLE